MKLTLLILSALALSAQTCDLRYSSTRDSLGVKVVITPSGKRHLRVQTDMPMFDAATGRTNHFGIIVQTKLHKSIEYDPGSFSGGSPKLWLDLDILESSVPATVEVVIIARAIFKVTCVSSRDQAFDIIDRRLGLKQ